MNKNVFTLYIFIIYKAQSFEKTIKRFFFIDVYLIILLLMLQRVFLACYSTVYFLCLQCYSLFFVLVKIQSFFVFDILCSVCVFCACNATFCVYDYSLFLCVFKHIFCAWIATFCVYYDIACF